MYTVQVYTLTPEEARYEQLQKHEYCQNTFV